MQFYLPKAGNHLFIPVYKCKLKQLFVLQNYTSRNATEPQSCTIETNYTENVAPVKSLLLYQYKSRLLNPKFRSIVDVKVTFSFPRLKKIQQCFGRSVLLRNIKLRLRLSINVAGNTQLFFTACYFSAMELVLGRYLLSTHDFTLGDSFDVKSPPRSSCGVTRPEELQTFIFKLGRGSKSGELVIGILSDTSWRAYTGPRYMAAALVKSGGAVSRSARDGIKGEREGTEIGKIKMKVKIRFHNMKLSEFSFQCSTKQ